MSKKTIMVSQSDMPWIPILCESGNVDMQLVEVEEEEYLKKQAEWREQQRREEASTQAALEASGLDPKTGALFFKTLQGDTHVLPYEASMTVMDLRTRLSERQGVPAEGLRLIFGGFQLEPSRTCRTIISQKTAPSRSCSV